jgi:hypothetical protein
MINVLHSYDKQTNKQTHIYKYGQSHIIILHQQVSVTQGVS